MGAVKEELRMCRWEEEQGNEAAATGKRQSVAAAVAPAGRKRKREADSEGDGSGVESETCGNGMQLVERTPVQHTLPPLQQLLNACRAALNGSSTPPTPTAVSSIRRIMDNIGPDDVGLMQEVRFFNKMNTAGRQNPPIITCKTIYECSNFTIAVFFLPWGAVMPLHNHPGMTVFSKLLIGSARVEAYDWVRPRLFTGWGSRMLAERVLDHTATAASGAWVLFPDAGGNMHRFVAGENEHCAFLDVLTPPYAETERRRCTYYQDVPYEPCPCVVRCRWKEVQKRRLAWLQEVSMPSSLRISNLRYRRPIDELLGQVA